MLPKSIQTAAEELLEKKFTRHVHVQKYSAVGGGCINNGGRLQTNIGDFFIKYNSNRYLGMFEAEAKGLELLRQANEMHVPEPLVSGSTSDGQIFLLLEWIGPGKKSTNFWEDFGRGLAKLHRHSAEKFGLGHDNYIGSLPQSNRQHSIWAAFFWEERLQPQIDLAKQNKLLPKETLAAFEKLHKELHNIFPEEPPALLHGDLWSGNYLTGSRGEPVIIDPAVYYGHREMEIAFTMLFGGFDQKFYSAYHEEYPLEKYFFTKRKNICNLYPLLVHLNLFGASYLVQIQQVLNKFASF